jgi:hypothetical protein
MVGNSSSNLRENMKISIAGHGASPVRVQGSVSSGETARISQTKSPNCRRQFNSVMWNKRLKREIR